MTESDGDPPHDAPPPSPGMRAVPFPRVDVRFGHIGRDYQPGEWLTVDYACSALGDEAIPAVERSVLWYTEGKGEEDLGVHFFERIATPSGVAAVVPDGTVAVRLPRSPLTYEGVIVKIRWCFRLRLFFESGRDHVSEHVFALGSVPPSLPP